MGSMLSKCFKAEPYVLSRTLKGHTKPINCLSFSPDGQLLASAADDREVRLWSTTKGDNLQTIRCHENGPVTHVLWATHRTGVALIFSCADGTVHVYTCLSNRPRIEFKFARGFIAHSGAIEFMDFDIFHQLLATSGNGEVKVWKVNPDLLFESLATQKSGGCIPRTVHFFDEGQSLMATYLEAHRILAWAVEPWKLLWERHVFSRIGNAAFSADNLYVLIDNLQTGSDSYTVPNMARLKTYKVPGALPTPKQVSFGPSGTIVIQGSDHGMIYISDFLSGATIQTLVHTTKGLVQTVTSHSHRDQHWIASSSSTGQMTIKIWQRKPAAKKLSVMSWGFFLLVASILLGAFAVQHTWSFQEILSRARPNRLHSPRAPRRFRNIEPPHSLTLSTSSSASRSSGLGPDPSGSE